MRWIFVGLLTVHGLIHIIGFANAFGLGEFPQLAQPISKTVGVGWLLAGILTLAAAAALWAAPRVWWVAAFGAVVVSQGVIFTSWSDAKAGTVANAMLLAAAVYGFAAQGPLSFRAAYRRAVTDRLTSPPSPELVAEADLKALPDPVQRYLRFAGSVGQPRVHHVMARWRGRIRAAPGDPWMPFTAQQYNFPAEPARFFLMDARKRGLPVDVFHAFRSGGAGMTVRLLSLVPLVESTGPEFDRAETVTLLNDLALLAPAALIDPAIRWEPVDSSTARVRYTVGPNTIAAVLRFGNGGELVDFVSDDRSMTSPDGSRLTQVRWSTPVAAYRSFAGRRAATLGEGRWHLPSGEFVYIELELVDLEINGAGPG